MNKIVPIAIALSTCFLFTGCTKKQNPDNTIKLVGLNFYQDELNTKKIVIKGGQGFSGGTMTDIRVVGDTSVLSLQLPKPSVLDLYTVGNKRLWTKIFVTPGDSIRFTNKNGQFQFEGENELYYRFGNLLKQDSIRYPFFDKDSEHYFKSCRAIYHKRQILLKSYTQKHASLSKAFVNRYQKELKYQYLNKLIQPILWNPLLDVELLAEFVSPLDILDFVEDNLWDSFDFKQALSLYIRYIFIKTKIVYSKACLEKEFNFIQKHLKGKLWQHSLTALLQDYSNNLLPETAEALKKIVEQSQTNITYTPYKKVFKSIREDLYKLNHKLPDSVTNITLHSFSNISVTPTFIQVLNSNKKEINIIDFWASWCTPCIKEIKQGTSLKKHLSEQYNVNWIYISIDEDFHAWQGMSNELKSYFAENTNYLYPPGENKNLLKYLNVKAIPHYLALNKKNQLMLNHMPKPSDSSMFEKIIKQLNMP